jgi:acetyl-CoA carboxylase biotin carboxyl carrier protein
MSGERRAARGHDEPPPVRGQAAEDTVLAGLPALLRDLAAAGVVEFEVSVGRARLYVRQRPGTVAAEAPSSEGGTAPLEEEGLVTVVAPLGGTFYVSPSPDEPPYVKEGDEVEQGQVIGLVEAMKVFNEIHAEASGTVATLLVSAGQIVQAGQPLMTIRLHAGETAASGESA